MAIAVVGMAGNAMAQQGEIKIGEINSYSLLPAFTEPYRKGWQLAVEEINAAGGINGKKLVVISKDDGGKPADAQTGATKRVGRTWRRLTVRSRPTSVLLSLISPTRYKKFVAGR